VLRRIVSAIALVAIASAPAVARTRLFCRYTGVEITDCAEQAADSSVVQVAGCCDHRITRPMGVVLQGHDREIAPPALHPLPAISMGDSSRGTSPAQRAHRCESPTGPPVYLITRALLI
jgi:hypothetical protein